MTPPCQVYLAKDMLSSQIFSLTQVTVMKKTATDFYYKMINIPSADQSRFPRVKC